MVRVNSRQTVWLLTRRFLKINRGRNIIAVLAVILTTVMFTASFTAVASVLRSSMNQDMRTSMDTSQISIQDLTKEQFEEICGYEKIKEMGYTVFLSMAENAELKTISAEIRYGDEKGAESYQCVPTQGRLPQREEEVATSTIVLDLLGVPHKVGSRITLTYTMAGKPVTETFRLSGYWEGDPLPLAQMVWVSEAYSRSHMKMATEESIGQGDYEGAYNLCLWFADVFRLNQYKEEIEERYHVSDTQAKMDIPPAYDKLFGEDGFPFATVGAAVILIFLSGYLIIFNVFQISVKNDIQAYGLLKNIGTTGRQLKSIVRRQALLLSGIGIPIGLLLGWLAGRAMVPYLLETEVGGKTPEVMISANAWLFLTAAVFALATVYIACMRPCQMVARVSPVEAVRMPEDAGRKGRKSGGATRGTPVALALGNLKGTWKRSGLVILSLALPLLFLNCAYAVGQGFDFDAYINSYISSDFRITGCGSSRQFSDLEALTPEFIREIAQQEEVETMARVYASESTHFLTDPEYKVLSEMQDWGEKEKLYDEAWAEQERKRLESRQVPAFVLGLDQEAFEKLYFLEGSCTWEEFRKGNYVITNCQSEGLGNYQELGDQTNVELKGQTRTFQIPAIGGLPYSMDYPFGAGTYYERCFYLPEKVYHQMGGGQGAMSLHIDVKAGKEKEFSRWLEDWMADKPQLLVESRMDLEKQCKQFAGRYTMILGALCLILFVIGILNFFNTSAVSVLSRKRELSLLEAVGMTRKQILKMLCLEGSIYFLAAMILADTAGLALMKEILSRTAGRAFFFHYYPSVTASLAALPFLVLTAWGIPWYHYRKICRESIVDRIRNE